jgi:hypothetical protein
MQRYASVLWEPSESTGCGKVISGLCEEYHRPLLAMMAQGEEEQNDLVERLSLKQQLYAAGKEVFPQLEPESPSLPEGGSDGANRPSATTHGHDVAAEHEGGKTLQEEERFIIAIEEFFALISGLVEELKGGILVYATDNKLVESWVENRTANHPLATYLLLLIAAIETFYHIQVFAGYIRTYHNTVADDFTRLPIPACLKKYGLNLVEAPSWEIFLSLGWIKRALLWEGQDPRDAQVAQQLTYHRNPPRPDTPLLTIWEVGDGNSNYARAARVSGASAKICSWKECNHLPKALTVLLVPAGRIDPIFNKEGRSGLITASGPIHRSAQAWLRSLVAELPGSAWCFDFSSLQELQKFKSNNNCFAEGNGPLKVCASLFGDQVQWTRYLYYSTELNLDQALNDLAAGAMADPSRHVAHFNLSWADNEKNIRPEEWRSDEIKLKKSRQTSCYPAAHVKDSRSPASHTAQPLPALHPKSWEPDSEAPLLLLDSTGSKCRVIREQEAARLLGSTREETQRNPQGSALRALSSTPPALAKWLVSAFLGQISTRKKVGVCSLPLEAQDESTCFRFTEREHRIRKTPLLEPANFAYVSPKP